MTRLTLTEARRLQAELQANAPSELVHALAQIDPDDLEHVLTDMAVIAAHDPDPAGTAWSIGNRLLIDSPDDPQGQAWLALHERLAGR